MDYTEVLRALAVLMEAERPRLAEDGCALDRRVLLAGLARSLGMREDALLRRGFTRAYRQLVEGV